MVKSPVPELTTSELAEKLGITPKSARGLIQRGHFPNARKIGTGKTMPYLIPLADLEAYLEKREAQKEKRRQSAKSKPAT